MGSFLSTLRKLFKPKTEDLPIALQPSTPGDCAPQDLAHVKIEPNPPTTGIPSPPVSEDPSLGEAMISSLPCATPATQDMTAPGPSQISEGSSATHSDPSNNTAAAEVINIHAPASKDPRPSSACSSQFIAPPLQPSKTFSSPFDLKGGPPKPLTLWGEAVERLRKETPGALVEKKENFQLATSLIDYIRDQRAKSDESRLHYTNSKNEKVCYAEVFLTQLEKYAKFGDIALQHHPDVVALAWSGFRLLLDLGLAYYKRMALISTSLGYLAWVMHCSAIYEALYLGTKQQSVNELKTRLVDQYVSILTYLVYAKQHVDKSAPKQILESLSTHLSRLLEDVRDCERRSRECADLVEKEAASLNRSRADASREKLKSQLEECRGQLQGLESSLNDCHMRLGVICDYLDELKLKDALNWISNLEYGANHRTHCERRTPNTCEWLEENVEFKEWLNLKSSPSAFWLCGDAGTGKSHLTSKVVDILINRTNQDPDNENSFVGNSAVAFFYCSYDLPQHSNPSSVLRAIVRQLCLAYSSGVPKSIMKLYEQRSLNSGGSLTLEESKRYIIELCKDFSDGVWIIIDALDELDSATRMEFFHVLNDIQVAVKTVRMFFSSRNESDIKSRMSAYNQHYIRPEDNSGDIRVYLDGKIEDLYSRSGGMRNYLETQRSKINALDTDANGMFLAVSLRIEELGRQVTEDGIDDTLRYNPQSLEEKYKNILSRIGKHTKTNNRNALNVIHWLYNTIDDRSPEILLQSLQITTDPHQDTNVPSSKISSTDDLYAICCGLVVLDKSTGILRFSHATVKEFLDQSSEYNRDEGRRWIADVCRQVLTNPMYGAYDNLSDIDDPNVNNIMVSPKLLIHYASRNWGHHLSTLVTKSSLNPQQWDGLLDPQSDVYRSWASSLRVTLPYLNGIDTRNTSLLWTACYYRLLPTFRECLKDSQDSDPNPCNQMRRTPLHHSAEHGDMEYVRLLLDHSNTDLNCRDKSMNTPLILAVQSKQMSVVLSLIARPAVDINHGDQGGRTALMHALLTGDPAIFRKLLQTGRCDLTLSDVNGDTVLHYAASKGSEPEVKRILRNTCAQALSLNRQNLSGETALSLATFGGYVRIVESILKASDDVLPNTTNADGEPPLFLAARLKHFDVLKVLVADSRVDINKRYRSETLLILAAQTDQHQVIKLLLAREDLDANATSGGYGWTALSYATYFGHLEPCKLLVKAQGVDSQHKDKDGDTALALARIRGDTSIVQILLEERLRGAAIPNDEKISLLEAATYCGSIQASEMMVQRMSEEGALNEMDSDMRTPLLLVTEAGMTSIVQFILERGGFDINHRDSRGYTACAHAAASGNPETLEMLLEQDGIDISTATGTRSTLLLLAAASGNPRSVRLLLARGGFDINHRDSRGYTACAHAASEHPEILEMLLEQDGIDVSIATGDGSTPLLIAAASGNLQCLQLILERRGCDINHRGRREFTALMLAAQNGHTEVVKILLKEEGIQLKTAHYHGTSPLLLSAEYGYVEIFEMLLDRYDKADELLEMDGDGDTILTLGSLSGEPRIVELALKRGAHGVNYRNKGGNTGLIVAASMGHTEVVDMLLREDGIDVSITNNDGHSAFDLAKKRGHKWVMTLLAPFLPQDG